MLGQSCADLVMVAPSLLIETASWRIRPRKSHGLLCNDRSNQQSSDMASAMISPIFAFRDCPRMHRAAACRQIELTSIWYRIRAQQYPFLRFEIFAHTRREGGGRDLLASRRRFHPHPRRIDQTFLHRFLRATLCESKWAAESEAGQ